MTTSAHARPLKIFSWNVAGFKGWIARHVVGRGNRTMKQFLEQHGADIYCFQEKKGYSGVATYVRPGLSVLNAWEGLREGSAELTEEGRCVTVDLGSFVLLNVYAPTTGQNREDRCAYKLRYSEALREAALALTKQGRNVIVIGDLNVVHTPLDTWNETEVAEHSVFREWMSSWVERVQRTSRALASTPSAASAPSSSSSASPSASSSSPSASSSSSATSASFTPSAASSSSSPSPSSFPAGDGRTPSNPSPASGSSSDSAKPAGDRAVTSVVSGPVISESARGDTWFVDSFRHLHPDRMTFSFWWAKKMAREVNRGVRVDYALVNKSFFHSDVLDSTIETAVLDSDHCPITLTLRPQPVLELPSPLPRAPPCSAQSSPALQKKRQEAKQATKQKAFMASFFKPPGASSSSSSTSSTSSSGPFTGVASSGGSSSGKQKRKPEEQSQATAAAAAEANAKAASGQAPQGKRRKLESGGKA